MYFWKCWRDTQPTLRAFCVALVLAHLFCWSVIQDWFGWVASGALNLPQAAWQQVADTTVRATTMLVPLAGFLLGGEGLSQEFQHKSMIYLLSRPRPRAYFLWISWGVGALQIVLLVLLAGVLDRVKPALAAQPSPSFGLLYLLKIVSVGIVVTLVLYSLTFLLGVLLRSGRYAVRSAMVACGLYSLAASFNPVHGLQLPTFYNFVEQATLSAALPDKYSYPLALASGWLALAMGMTIFSHWSFGRFEPES